jgi:formylglycine-generating enzyme required for sulfatase activity
MFPGGVADWWRVIGLESEGIHDLAGNVWEWMASPYTADYAGAYRSVLNANYGSSCVLRCGSWRSALNWVRGAARGMEQPYERYNDLGFRLART